MELDGKPISPCVPDTSPIYDRLDSWCKESFILCMEFVSYLQLALQWGY